MDTGTAKNAVSREKYWSELTDSEKIERMRDEVKAWQRKCAYLGQCVDALLQHRHDTNGIPVGPIDRQAGRDEVRQNYARGDDVRF